VRTDSRRALGGLCAIAAAVGLTTGLIAGCSSAVRVSDSADVRNVRTVRPQPSIVEHWGSFFGASKGIFDLQTSPVTVTLPGTVAEVGSSNSTEYALLTDGSLYAWGMGNAGQLGDGSTQNSFAAAVRVHFPPGVKIWSIPTDAMPYDTGLAIDTTGRVWGWGNNFGGELCLGNTRLYTTPVALPLSHVTSAAGANNHALYDANGTVYACGLNADGDLGIGTWRNTTTPARVIGLDGSQVITLVASFANSGALLSDGQYFDWGYNGSGQLGDGRPGRQSDIPVLVRLPARVTQVAQGGSLWNNGQTVAMLSDGALWAWGDNHACQLGPGPARLPLPVRLPPPPAARYVGLATGSATSYAVTSAGAVYSWGVSHVGQVGNGLTSTVCTPVKIASGGALISSTADNVVVSIPAAK
jgi:alpha-tubulin suppressor-like RCC1 family protein